MQKVLFNTHHSSSELPLLDLLNLRERCVREVEKSAALAKIRFEENGNRLNACLENTFKDLRDVNEEGTAEHTWYGLFKAYVAGLAI